MYDLRRVGHSIDRMEVYFENILRIPVEGMSNFLNFIGEHRISPEGYQVEKDADEVK